MENMVILPWSSHESWRTCQETWPPCRHHGMVMTMFRHDHTMIMARSWHGSHVFPTRDGMTLFYYENLKKRLLRQRKHSRYMYARCLNCLCLIFCLLAFINAPYKIFKLIQQGHLTGRLCFFSLLEMLNLQLRFDFHVNAFERWKRFFVFFGIPGKRKKIGMSAIYHSYQFIAFPRNPKSKETHLSSVWCRHTIKSRREKSVNFGQFREVVSWREINEVSVKKQRKNVNFRVFHIFYTFVFIIRCLIRKICCKNSFFWSFMWNQAIKNFRS